MEFVGRVYKLRDKLALKFLELAEKYPKDPIAVDALIQAVWQVNSTPWPVELVGKDSAWPRAIAILLRDHVRSDKLGQACQRISFGFRKEYETFLRTVLEKNPHKDVQALACLSLAQFLNDRLQRLDLVTRSSRNWPSEFDGLFGKDYLEDLQRQDRAKAAKEVEALFEQAAEKYGDVKIPRRRHGRREGQGGAVRDPPPGRRQGGAGHRRRGPGRQALQAERLPRQGGAARLLAAVLTDLTGPVAPRAVARHEAERQALRPDRRQRQRQRRAKKLKEVMDKEKLNWRSFADQGHRRQVEPGPTPTFYVLDPKGVIRHKWVGSPGEGHRHGPGEADPRGGGRPCSLDPHSWR